MDIFKPKEFAKHGTKIVVINNDALSPQEEMTKDLLSIVHCFSSRLYGLRKYKNELKKIVQDTGKRSPGR
jgi:predicted site-specific integrase-resolvase